MSKNSEPDDERSVAPGAQYPQPTLLPKNFPTHTNKIKMGIKSLKIGSHVTLKHFGTTGVISDILNGKYKLSGNNIETYNAGDLIAKKVAPEPKKNKKINKVADKTAVLKKIYQQIHPGYLEKNPHCDAKLDGCTGIATQIHHRYKRTGFYLIMSKLFCPICDNCHDDVNVHSAEAIAAGISISRKKDVKYDFTPEETRLMTEYAVNPPI